MAASTRERLADAAFALFDEQGYDATTVEQVVERAGVSRSTFFRAFGSKEDVIFPRHDDLLARIGARLATGTAQTYLHAIREGAALVLAQYLAEGHVALSRYRLTRSVPALRDREIASTLGYQRLFREHARHWLTELGGPDVELHAELLAASVVTAHNVVLRRWLRGETTEPWREFEDAMDTVLVGPGGGPSGGPGGGPSG
ncbi:TetR/AcrR family transcriptional regulator, partial [Nocardioides dongxiaopingii]|uniref:TetR/AcrR family transcriptional regulator n=1 Tax=Nocardioides dongxiaopingii TaxID=2576036 RepID=UPI0010C76807